MSADDYPESTSGSFEDSEASYKAHHSRAVFLTDSQSGVLCLAICTVALIKFLLIQPCFGVAEFWPRVCTIFAFVTAVLVGIGPIVYLPMRKKALYLRSRDIFLFHSMLCCLVIYSLIIRTEAITLPESRTQFLFKFLGLGPHIAVLILSLAYPLRVPAAFPFSCIIGVGATIGCYLAHPFILASSAGLLHLDFLASNICPSGAVQELVFLFANKPCGPDNVLLFIWGAQGVASVVLMFFLTVRFEARRKKVFVETRGLREASLFLWVDYFLLYHWLAHFVIGGTAMLAL